MIKFPIIVGIIGWMINILLVIILVLIFKIIKYEINKLVKRK